MRLDGVRLDGVRLDGVRLEVEAAAAPVAATHVAATHVAAAVRAAAVRARVSTGVTLALGVAGVEALLEGTPCMPLNRASNSRNDPMPHAPAVSAERHHGSEYQPAGTGRPETLPPG